MATQSPTPATSTSTITITYATILEAILLWHEAWASPDIGGYLYDDDLQGLALTIYNHLRNRPDPHNSAPTTPTTLTAFPFTP